MNTRLAAAISATAVAFAALLASAGSAAAYTVTCSLSVGGGFSPGMSSAGSTGTYVIDTQGLAGQNRCVRTDLYPYTLHVTFTSRGTYTASACGTAVLTGDPTAGATKIEDPFDPFHVDTANMSYTLEIRNWVAILRITRMNTNTEQGGDDVDGVLAVVPQHACLSQPVESFTLEGSFTYTW